MKDYTAQYMITKKIPEEKSDVSSVINFIYDYIQNNEIYFFKDPAFINNVLLFSLIGLENDLISFERTAFITAAKFNCKVDRMLLKEKIE